MNQSSLNASPRANALLRSRVGGRKGRVGFAAVLLALAFGVFSANAMAGPPMVSTAPATNIGGTGASLVGSIFPNGLTTTYYFEYGTTTSYGSNTAPVVIGSTEGGIKFREVNGLTPGITYHFRVVATNSAGKEAGLDKTFTTTVGWRQLHMSSPTAGKPARFKGVSCPAANTCFAVGEQELTAGSPSALIERWNGSTWTVQSIAGTVSSLDGISCISASDCTAVGYVKSGTESLPAAVRYNGTTWNTTTVPGLSGVTQTALRDVSCTTKGVCLAVGYSGVTATHIPFAVRWSSGGWSLQNASPPSETTSSELTGVSCLAVPFEGFPSLVINKCNAVGWREKGGAKQSMVGFWQEAWSGLTVPPLPSGAKSSQLTGVSCPASSSMNWCMATGSYVNSEGAQAAFTQSWSVGTWAAPAVGAVSLELSGVSCVSSSVCEAVGNAPKSGPISAAAQRYTAGAWTAQSPPPFPVGTPAAVKATFVDGGVSCEAAGNCMGVGFYEDSAGFKVPVAMYYG